MATEIEKIVERSLFNDPACVVIEPLGFLDIVGMLNGKEQTEYFLDLLAKENKNRGVIIWSVINRESDFFSQCQEKGLLALNKYLTTNGYLAKKIGEQSRIHEANPAVV